MPTRSETLTAFIHEAETHGLTKEIVYSRLLEEGWRVDEINHAYVNKMKVAKERDTSARTIRIVVNFGAIFVGAGIFSFIAANWTEMDRFVKMGIILISMLAAYTSAWVIHTRTTHRDTAQALFLLGAFIYGAGLFLVAQIFNVRVEWPHGFILWMIGVLATAFAIRSNLLLLLALPLAFFTLVGLPFSYYTVGFNTWLMCIGMLLTLGTGWLVNQRVVTAKEAV